jgi:hypothetical protein
VYVILLWLYSHSQPIYHDQIPHKLLWGVYTGYLLANVCEAGLFPLISTRTNVRVDIPLSIQGDTAIPISPNRTLGAGKYHTAHKGKRERFATGERSETGHSHDSADPSRPYSYHTACCFYA